MSNYFAIRDKLVKQRLNEIVNNDLPTLCRPFFASINSSTASLTKLNYAYDLRVFFKFIAEEVLFIANDKINSIKIDDIRQITSYHIDQFMMYLDFYNTSDGKSMTNSARGKSRKLSSIKSLFFYLLKNNFIEKDPTSFINMPKIVSKDIIRLEKNEIGKLLATVESGIGLTVKQKSYQDNTKIRDIAIITLLVGTGIRVSECVGINMSDIDFANSSFTVTRKGGNKVILYFSKEVADTLINYYTFRLRQNEALNVLDKDALFLSLQLKRISTRAVQNLVKKYSSIATPLKQISPHKLRSTYGTQLYRATHDIYIVADVLGHKDVNTTRKHYAAISEDLRKKAANKLKLVEFTDDNND